MLNTRRIADMSQYLMVEGSLQLLAALVEELELMGRERIETVIIASHEVREHAARDDGVLMFQSAYQLLHIVLGIEAQAVHAGIQLDMHRETSALRQEAGTAHHILQLSAWARMEIIL